LLIAEHPVMKIKEARLSTKRRMINGLMNE
jgi:hypothetical protein